MSSPSGTLTVVVEVAPGEPSAAVHANRGQRPLFLGVSFPSRRFVHANGRDLAQRLLPIRRIDAQGKQLPGCLMACAGVLYWHFWVAAKGEEIVPAVESIAVVP